MSIDRRIQDFLKRNLTLEDAVPTKMPAYVNSFGYFFGTMTLSALAMLFITGIWLSVFGPVWRHTSSLGAFVNAMHFWSVDMFYFAVILHILFKFFTAAWRDGRWRTWLAGWLIFAASIFSGISGTLLQQNWDSQWNSQQGKDAFAALGLGWLNWMNYDSVLTLHVVVFAVIVLFFAGAHLFLIRREGPVHPIVHGGRRRTADGKDE
jgi:quinol-cytochrome oxidoreductase complex cytochrome b subunit